MTDEQRKKFNSLPWMRELNQQMEAFYQLYDALTTLKPDYIEYLCNRLGKEGESIAEKTVDWTEVKKYLLEIKGILQ